MARKTRALYDEVGARKTIYVEDVKPKAKSSFQGGKFMLVAIDTFRMLYEMDLPHTADKIMHWLCAHNTYGNVITGWTQATIAHDCKTHRTHVSRMLRELERRQLILHGNGTATLNPYLWYYGSLEAQHEAQERWDSAQAKRGQVLTQSDWQDSGF